MNLLWIYYYTTHQYLSELRNNRLSVLLIRDFILFWKITHFDSELFEVVWSEVDPCFCDEVEFVVEVEVVIGCVDWLVVKFIVFEEFYPLES